MRLNDMMAGIPPLRRTPLGATASRSGERHGGLRETHEFGADPGGLRMLSFVPDVLPQGGALVVALHGCTQTAADYDVGTGWSDLARRLGFAVLLPEQRRCNNSNLCFNWFEPADTRRGHGEVASIRAMIATMLHTHRLDPARVFVSGLSAGGAMAGAMLATYPDIFAGGGIIAGLPYGVAGTVGEALDLMLRPGDRSARMLGDLVRAAGGHGGSWPSVSIWHGAADTTVRSGNAREIEKQWRDVHGLDATSDLSGPDLSGMVDGYPYRAWLDATGRVAVESYEITGMAHGAPIATRGAGGPARHGGVAGPFILDVGIWSSFRLAQRWGLVDARAVDTRTPQEGADAVVPSTHASGQMQAPGQARDRPVRAIDPGRIIGDALRAAGLLGRL